MKGSARILRVDTTQESGAAMTDPTYPETVGTRVARARKRRALTQHGLAERTRYSRSHIAQIESGHKVATPSFIAASAHAMGIDPTELTGQPYRGDTATDDRVHATIPEVRRAVATTDVPMDLGAAPRSLDSLAEEVQRIRELSKAARHVQVGTRLPAVLDELAVHTVESGTPRAWTLLNAAQALAASLARRLGYNDMATNAITAARWAASESEDPNLNQLAQLSRALLLLTLGAWSQGLQLVHRARADTDTSTPAGTAVAGALRLRAAILSARAGDTATAWDQYGHAGELAVQLPPQVPDYYALQFNHANVALHGAAVAVELRDFDEAIRRDHALDTSTSGLPPERRAHHEIDMARVHDESGDYDTALGRLLVAERVAPQMTRYHPSARMVIGHLVDIRRTIPEPLRGIQSRMRIR